MLSPLAIGPDWLDPQVMVEAFGDYAIWGVLLIVFAECGLLIGFFLPGDALLFTVGLLIASGVIDTPLWLACPLLVVAALLGNICGYLIGQRVGPAVFRRSESRFFRQEYVDKTREFFAAHGNKAIVLARFIPIVRTFITVVAGVANMGLRRFATYSAIGAVLWGAGVTVAGYFLGQIAFVRHNIEVILIAIVAVSLLPVALEVARAQLTSRSSRAKADR